MRNIKNWLIKKLGGYTSEEYKRDINLISNNHIFRDGVVCEPVRVVSEVPVLSENISGFSRREISEYMTYIEKQAKLNLIKGLDSESAISIVRDTDNLGDFVVRASIDVLMPQQTNNERS